MCPNKKGLIRYSECSFALLVRESEARELSQSREADAADFWLLHASLINRESGDNWLMDSQITCNAITSTNRLRVHITCLLVLVLALA